MAYLEDIVYYLAYGPESNEEIWQSIAILGAMDSLDASAFPLIVSKPLTARFFPAVAEDAHSAYLLRRGYEGSKQFYDAALKYADQKVLEALKSSDRRKVLEIILSGAGYDVAQIGEAEPAFSKELRIWGNDHSYYIPVRDFCGPPIEEPKQAFTNKKKVRGIDDFNEYSSWGISFFEWFKKIIATANEPSVAFFGQYIVLGMPSSTSNLTNLRETNSVVDAVDIPKMKAKNTQAKPAVLEYRQRYMPTHEGDFHVPINFEIEGVSGRAVNYRQAFWNLDMLIAKQGHVPELVLPQEFTDRIEWYRRSKGDKRYGKDFGTPPDIARYLKYSFKYKQPPRIKGLSRFEAAAHSGRGVCQDVNFLLFYILRKLDVPSLIINGHQLEGKHMTKKTGHSKVLAKYEGKWLELDATPYKAGHGIGIGEMASTAIDFAKRKLMLALQYRSRTRLLEELKASFNEAVAHSIQLIESLPDSVRPRLYSNLARDISNYHQRIGSGKWDYTSPNESGIDVKAKYREGQLEVKLEIDPKKPTNYELRNMIKNIRYHAASFPEYVNLLLQKQYPEELERELKEGEIKIPLINNLNIEEVIGGILTAASLNMNPPLPSATYGPWLSVLHHKKKNRIVKDKSLKEAYTYPNEPRDQRDQRLRALFGVDSDWHVWMEYPDLKPDKNHYLFSTEVLIFEKKREENSSTYWGAVRDYLIHEIAIGEKGLPIIIGELSAARNMFLKGQKADTLFDNVKTLIDPAAAMPYTPIVTAAAV